MTAFVEPLEVPAVRTLIALQHWPTRSARARPNLHQLAVMDFLLRFPVALERVFALRERELPADARSTLSERDAPENQQLESQLALWPSRHRLVAAGLIGRGLARSQPAVAGSGLALTASGAQVVATLGARPEWIRVDARSRALGSKLAQGAVTLPGLAHRAVATDRLPAVLAYAGQA